jgi:hypothetical protein
MLPAENEKPSIHGLVGIRGTISRLKTYLRALWGDSPVEVRVLFGA